MRYSILTFLLVLSAVQLTAQDSISSITPLTYEQAITLMIENNETLKQSAIKIEQKEYESKSKTGLYMPRVSLTANYVMMTDAISLDLTDVRDAITPLYENLGKYGNFSGMTSTVPGMTDDEYTTAAVRAGLVEGEKEIMAAEWDQTIQEQSFGMVSANFIMPIYAGGKIRIANKAAKIEVEEATVESRQKLGEVTMELVERYYGLLLAQKVEVVRENVKKTMQSHMDDAEMMKDEGLISNTQFLQAKVYYTEAKREKDKATKQVEIVNNALINTLTIPLESEVSILSSFFYHEQLEPMEHFQTMATENSPLLAQIEHKQALVEQKVHLEKGNYLPTIAATGTYTLADKDLSPYIPQGMIGVGLSWTIFEGTSRNKDLKAAQLQGEQVELYYSKSKSNIFTMINKCYQEADMSLEQIEQLEVSKEFAMDYVNACEKSFREGLATSIEVSDANLLLAKMEIEQLQATYNYDVMLSKLLYYAGIPEQFNDYLSKGITIE